MESATYIAKADSGYPIIVALYAVTSRIGAEKGPRNVWDSERSRQFGVFLGNIWPTQLPLRLSRGGKERLIISLLVRNTFDSKTSITKTRKSTSPVSLSTRVRYFGLRLPSSKPRTIGIGDGVDRICLQCLWSLWYLRIQISSLCPHIFTINSSITLVLIYRPCYSVVLGEIDYEIFQQGIMG